MTTAANKLIVAFQKHPIRTIAILPIQIGAAITFVVVIGIAKAIKFFKEIF